MAEPSLEQFKAAVLPHLDAAYNLARWLTRHEHDAQDIVQDAYLRAWKAFGEFHGGDSRAWLLTIVRNACYTWHRSNRRHEAEPLPEEDDSIVGSDTWDPAEILLQRVDAQVVRQAIDQMPPEFREVLVLRELEGLSYKQVAAVIGAPIGTVMSRLARARGRLQELLLECMPEEA